MSPESIVARVLAGAIVGFLVGLTGLGGGVLLVPILISALGVPAIVAVGSDALVNAVTKVGAGIVHWRRGNVRWWLVVALIGGSIPGAALGVGILTRLHSTRGSGVNDFLKIAIAVLLIIIPVTYLAAKPFSSEVEIEAPKRAKKYAGIILIGFLVGILVGITSIGSGTVTVMLLLVFYGFTPRVVVGTDVVHALLLTGFTAMLQARLGNVDFALVGYILIGSIPAGIVGASMASRISATRLKQILCSILVVLGIRMLWTGIAHAAR